jgi:FkbM family methyltransferase
LSPNAKIFAFEPSSIARKDLENSFAGEKRIEIFPFALSSSSGKAVLWSDKAGSGLGSLTKRRLDHFNIDFNVNEEIQILTLDEWNSSRRLKPDLIKIDVEGHELDVLKGGECILKDTKLVQFEFGGCNIDSRTYFQDFWYFFSSRGFSIYRVSPYGPILIAEYDEEDEHFRTTNYLAVRK